MKAIIIVCVIAAVAIIGGLVLCLCVADEDDFSKWEDEHNETDNESP